jgi:exopolysaccharide production protein ExoZ
VAASFFVPSSPRVTVGGSMIVNIQALRALAALLVVCVHMAAFGTLLGWQPRATAFGNCGVDLFFVISGFIMMHTIMARPITARAFLLHRIVRVVPLYWMMTLVVFTVALAAPSLLGDTRADGSALILSLAFIPFDRGGGVVEPLFFLGWTLNYEMFFYACFAVALWIGRGRVGVTMLICGGLIASCVSIGWLLRPHGVLPGFYTNDIMIEFVFGMMMAHAVSVRPSAPRIVAATMVVAGLFFIVGVVPLLHAPRWSTAGVAATSVLLGAIWAERGGLRASAGWVQTVGAASYALYLTHPFVLQAFAKAAARLGGGEGVAVAFAVLGLTASVLAAVMIHNFVEVPLTHCLRRVLGHGRALSRRPEPLAMEGIGQA